MNRVLLLLLIIALLIISPIAAIWSLNHLFNMNLEYTFNNWCSVLILGVFVRGTTSTSWSSDSNKTEK